MTRPCPFCGAEEGLHEYKQWPGYRCVACQRCGTNCTADLWNERPIEDALLAEVMQLRAALERIRDRDCLGNGRVWAASAMAPAYSTEPCPACGGTGHWVPGNAAEVAELALKISDLSRKGKSDGS